MGDFGCFLVGGLAVENAAPKGVEEGGPVSLGHD